MHSSTISLQMLLPTFSILNTDMHDTHRKLCTRTISDDCSIPIIIIKKSLKEFLQISKVMACCLVPNKAFNADTY